MDRKKPPSLDSSDRGRNAPELLQRGNMSTETIDLKGLFEEEVTDSGSFDIGSNIWTSTFGKVIQALPIPVFLIDQSRNVMAANQACRKLGAGYEMVVGKPFSQLLANPLDATRSASLVSTVFSTRKTAVWESLLKIDENSVWSRLTFRPIRIRDQRFLLILVEDLSLEKRQRQLDKQYKKQLEERVKERTEELRSLNEELLIEMADRKRSEEALRLSEERYRQLFEDAPLMYVITRDKLGVPIISNCNELFLHSLGYKRKEVLGQPLADFYSPQSRADLLEGGGYARALAGEFLIGERELMTRDGRPVPTLLHTALELDASRQVIGTRAMFVDITERKRVEQALRESEERFKAIFESHHAVMLIIDPESGRIMDGSPGACAFYGYDREELKRKKISEINTLSPEQAFKRMQMAKSQQRRYFDFQHRLANGEVRDVEACTGPIVTGGEVFLFSVINDVTERKRAEEALKESEQRYRSLFEESGDGVYAVLRDGEITDANPAFLEIFGYTKDEMIGKDILELYVNPRDRAKFQVEIEKHRFVKNYEVEYRKKDGKHVDCLLTSSVQFADDGSILGYRGIVRDVTEQKRTADALKESEKRYRMLFEAASDAIYILQAEGDEQGRIISANKEAAAIHGYTIPELLTMNITDLDTPKSAEKVGDRMERMLRGETVREVTTHRRKDGTVFPIEINARLIEVGDREYILAIDRDVTEREKAETALRESEQRLRLINDSSPVGIRIVQDGEYVYVNPSFVRMFGYETQDQIIGFSLETLYAPESRDLILRRHADKSAGKAVPSHYEAIGITQRGKRFDVETWGTEIEYLGRRSSLAFVMDVSEAKSLRSQLLQAQKMEAIGTLAGGIAHDFNNLLTVILGYSELIVSEKEEGDKDYEDLAKIIHAARTAGDMVQQILAFSRKTETKLRPIDLNKQVEHLRKMLSRLIPKTIEVEINLDSGLPTVNADPAQIEQVLMNLAVNARDAMPDGGRLLIETQAVLLDDKYCRSHLAAAPGPHALLIVTDSGTGIDRSTMDRIFEPFYTTKKPGQGTGLGLAMVYGIVKSHGGHITCDSDPGRGTAFRVYLPAHEVEGDTAVSTSREFAVLGTGTILLADDEEFVRQLAQRILEKAGYTVLTATNGQEAVEVYKEKGNQISLVILDLIMPVMDGHQCLAEILRIDPAAKVLVASGYSPGGTRRETLEGRVRGFVGKPYDLKQLLKTVRDALDEE